MIYVFRILILIALLILTYSAFKYLFHPRRKLEQAHEKKQYFFYDDDKDVRKNFLLTYKGVMFEGEKYLGTTNDSFDIVTVYIWVKHPEKLAGLTKEDFTFITDDVQVRYPSTKVEWKSPIKEFLKKN
ncbi:sigma-w pathway protein ysdB [Bacillus suaedae]|uniref:Sigma-w pathway protein ysdB n=1 Tax=Halalkalibacter suaedae TaxID=2822140 RepID=A0A941ALS7_9BACI|nr:sigma-w pathway protein ysdB [Bacillus suaedae]MBP3949720.1 sigma-w pathway protein ysdB [Bacillus suaedae]